MPPAISVEFWVGRDTCIVTVEEEFSLVLFCSVPFIATTSCDYLIDSFSYSSHPFPFSFLNLLALCRGVCILHTPLLTN